MEPASEPVAKIPDQVSVIITCFNHGGYLSKAIDSVIEQTYKSIEIVIVDDGSTDNTKQVAESYSKIKYIYQQNQGLSAARNTGIAESTGKYLVFLDADDWLLPNGIATNVKYFASQNSIGLVSGNYMRYYEKTGEYKFKERVIKEDVYAELLINNHLTMHGAVMFSRFVFNYYKYDVKLKSAEDWDLTLAISRHHPVVQHNEFIAVYRRYGTSMSSNNVLMLNYSLIVLRKQKKRLRTSREKQNLKIGCEEHKRKFTKNIYNKIIKNKEGKSAEFFTLLKHNPNLFLKLIIYKFKLPIKSIIAFLKSKIQ